MNKKKTIILAVAGAVITTAIVAGTASAFGTKSSIAKKFFSDKRGDIQQAIEQGDYSAWQEAVADRFDADLITEENFNKFVELYRLKKEGKYDEAKKIYDDMDLPVKKFTHMKDHGFMKFHRDRENSEAIRAALDNNDYSAWLEAVGKESQMAEKINADNFERLVEMHDLHEQARAIAEELGIGFGNWRE